MKRILLIPSLIALSLLTFSLSKKPSQKLALKSLKDFCELVPSGKTLIGKDTLSVQSFYMSATEVSNFQYQEFLDDLKKNGELQKLEIAMYDSLLWNKSGSSMEPFTSFYHSHPAYQNYPVVNISKEGAQLFCDWLSEKYKGLSGGELKLKFRLPTHAEWMRAARGETPKRYSWGGPYLQNARGCYLANFLNIGAESVTRNEETGELEVKPVYSVVFNSDMAMVTAPVKSYFPNENGIYNLNGNVAEMIADKNIVAGGDWGSPGYDVRNESQRSYNGAESKVGFRVVATYVE